VTEAIFFKRKKCHKTNLFCLTYTTTCVAATGSCKHPFLTLKKSSYAILLKQFYFYSKLSRSCEIGLKLAVRRVARQRVLTDSEHGCQDLFEFEKLGEKKT